MDQHNEEIEEIILDEEEVSTDDSTDSLDEAAMDSKAPAKAKQMKNVAGKKSMKEEEEEEEEEEEAIEEDAANASSAGAGAGKLKGLYKDGTGKGAVIPGPVDVGAGEGDSKSKLMKSVKAKKAMREDVEVHMTAMFDGEDLSEDFKSKATTIFEAAINERVEEIRAELEEEYSNRLSATIEESKTALTEQLDSYLAYVVEEWLAENRLAVEKGIRTEIAEEFMNGLRNLFVEHDIAVPESKVDIADQMAETAEQLKARLDEEIMKNVSLTEEVKSYKKQEILDELSEDLTVTQKERFQTLAEGVTLDGEESDVRSKLNVIKESYFSGKSQRVLTEETAATAEETIDGSPSEGKVEFVTESMKAYADVLSRIAKR
jgi:AcrR family transcriptional regulator